MWFETVAVAETGGRAEDVKIFRIRSESIRGTAQTEQRGVREAAMEQMELLPGGNHRDGGRAEVGVRGERWEMVR